MELPQAKAGMYSVKPSRPRLTLSPSLLFATTNHIDRLDEALRRPGRMDVWINFKYATKWQAEGIFKCFFPSVEDAAAAAAESQKTAEAKGETVAPKRKTYSSIPLLCAKELEVLAKQFAEAIPENELSVSCNFYLALHMNAHSRFQVAGLQGYLLKNKVGTAAQSAPTRR